MPRPSLKSERQTQILDAYGRCIARYGVEGATLERIASEANMARALIRHNVGNRDELLDRFVDRFLEESEWLSEQMVQALSEQDMGRALIDGLFERGASDTQFVRIANALIVAAADRSDLAVQMRAWSNSFVDALDAVFKDRVVAMGVASLYADVEAMSPLGDDAERRHLAHQAAYKLAGLD